ncbi:hypothetical protein DBZ36_15005 [Alginatibacterium sediminis]|uniref:DUF6998 domain-containing protein n=1 Tax=Alginatibacterium sediminis TaxID=2164068 RepID=A0A420E8M9_9ALTE|nr:hypothetical protein [Alginatibacterium sediminis]RKF15688.1 hypothetical protein DBZ36_15005 [Alginatibacterium sediminis]
MLTKEFIDNDSDYLNWINQNPAGFVINTYRANSSTYNVLHSANCSYISVAPKNSPAGAFTERNYKKVCSNKVSELRGWLHQHVAKNAEFSTECGRCKPWTLANYEQAILESEGLSLEHVNELYDKYLQLIQFEVEQLGVKATEARHLIGRLGEFYCAKILNGKISTVVNQHGFDVISETGHRVSVKTTAQITGFVRISARTLHLVDNLMILQYQEGRLLEVFYGDIKLATSNARFYEDINCYELDISKARRLHNEQLN